MHQRSTETKIVNRNVVTGILRPCEAADCIPVANERGAESQPDARVMPAAYSEANREQ